MEKEQLLEILRVIAEAPEKFDKNKWIAFAKETIKNDDASDLLNKLDFNAFGILMEKVYKASGEIESILWSGVNPSGTEDRTWVRVWAYLSGAKDVYYSILTGLDKQHANRILKQFKSVGYKGTF